MVDPHEPTAAERIRSLLDAAGSLDVLAAQRRVPLRDRHLVTADGRLVLRLPADGELALELVSGGGRSPALIEITDVAPVAMRNRVRARATLVGKLSAGTARSAGDLVATFDVQAAELVERGRVTRVGAAEFTAAGPDPLATREPQLLCHLVGAHGDFVTWLTRLVPADRLDGVRRAYPLRLDRHGVVLRLEFPDLDRDVRLAFATPVDEPADAPARMLELLARARTCGRAHGRTTD